MHALIINRTCDTTRLNFQLDQLKNLGIQSIVVEAVEAKTLPEETIATYRNNWQRALRETEIACLLSHHKCWGIIAEKNEPFLILEDDAVLCNHARVLLQEVEEETQYDLISLETRRRTKFLSKDKRTLSADYGLYSMFYDKGGAAGYIVWPSGAHKLLAHLERHGAAPADAFLGDCKNLNRGQIAPAPIIQLDMCEHYNIEKFSDSTSTIFTNNPRPKAGSALAYCKFKARRCIGQLKLGLKVQSKKYFSTKYKEVEINIERKDFVR